MTRKRSLMGFGLIILCLGLSFVYHQWGLVRHVLRFDLKILGESIYQARTQSGNWPETIEDLAGTEYLKMPYRRQGLENGQFIIVWPKDLDVDPAKNPDAILTYDNRTVLSRLGA